MNRANQKVLRYVAIAFFIIAGIYIGTGGGITGLFSVLVLKAQYTEGDVVQLPAVPVTGAACFFLTTPTGVETLKGDGAFPARNFSNLAVGDYSISLKHYTLPSDVQVCNGLQNITTSEWHTASYATRTNWPGGFNSVACAYYWRPSTQTVENFCVTQNSAWTSDRTSGNGGTQTQDVLLSSWAQQNGWPCKNGNPGGSDQLQFCVYKQTTTPTDLYAASALDEEAKFVILPKPVQPPMATAAGMALQSGPSPAPVITVAQASNVSAEYATKYGPPSTIESLTGASVPSNEGLLTLGVVAVFVAIVAFALVKKRR